MSNKKRLLYFLTGVLIAVTIVIMTDKCFAGGPCEITHINPNSQEIEYWNDWLVKWDIEQNTCLADATVITQGDIQDTQDFLWIFCK